MYPFFSSSQRLQKLAMSLSTSPPAGTKSHKNELPSRQESMVLTSDLEHQEARI